MTVKQMSIFLENKPGQLAELVHELNKNNIDMRAMSLAETTDFGILRLIVNDTYETACVLKNSGFVFSITPVIAVAIPDETGGLTKVLEILCQNNVNVEYAYAFTSNKTNGAYMIFRVTDEAQAAKVLAQNGINLIKQDEISNI